MSSTMTKPAGSAELLEINKKQKKLGYQIKRNKEIYAMMAPYFILFFRELCRRDGGNAFVRLRFHQI